MSLFGIWIFPRLAERIISQRQKYTMVRSQLASMFNTPLPLPLSLSVSVSLYFTENGHNPKIIISLKLVIKLNGSSTTILIKLLH